MASTPSWLVTALPRRLRGPLGVRFARFAGAAVAALTATEVALTICTGVFHLTATPAALASWFAGAVVSYAMSRWAWNRTGKPDVLRETVPFWAISAVVIVLLTLANKLGYHSAAWLHLTGAKHVLWVDFVWLLANFGTFLLRFLILHYILFADRSAVGRDAVGRDAVGRDAIGRGAIGRGAVGRGAAPVPQPTETADVQAA
jgi:putative flippase GtrA